MKIIIVVAALLIVIGTATGFAYYRGYSHNKDKRFQRGNFPINESQINELTSFFNNTTNLDEIKNYCNTNRVNCFYYCRNINPNHEICKDLFNYNRSNYIQGPGGKPDGITNKTR